MQRIRGGVFEFLTVFSLPWIELGFELEWYTTFLHAATGLELSWDNLNCIANRIFNLIRVFWIREHGDKWTKNMGTPPARWFEEPLTKGSLRGSKLDRSKYDVMLQKYYRKRG